MAQARTHKSQAQTKTAKVFMNGRSQAVRLPAAFRVSAKELFVRRDEQTGDLILSETPPAVRSMEQIFKEIDALGGIGDLFDNIERKPSILRDWMK